MLEIPGLNVNTRDYLGQSPFFTAVTIDSELVKMMLEIPGLDWDTKTLTGLTPYKVVVDPEVKALLQQKMDSKK